MMRFMLRVPLLQRIVGKGTALVTVIGRKSGRRITTPISYHLAGDVVVLTGHPTRQWVRNVAANPYVEIRLAGRDRRGNGRLVSGDDAMPHFLEFLRGQRMLAKAYGVRVDSDGNPNPTDAEVALDATAVVVIDLTDQPAPMETSS